MLHQMEALEIRRLMSRDTSPFFTRIDEVHYVTVGPQASIVQAGQVIHSFITKTGTLLLEGSGEDDRMIVIQDGAWLKISSTKPGDARDVFVIKASNVKRILVEGFGGDDKIFVDPEVSKPTTVVGGSGDDVIEGKNGSTLIGGLGNDKLLVPPGTAVRGTTRFVIKGNTATFDPAPTPSLLVGGQGNDTLVANVNDTVVGGVGDDIAFQASLLSAGNPGSVAGVVSDNAAEFFPNVSGVEQAAGNVKIHIAT